MFYIKCISSNGILQDELRDFMCNIKQQRQIKRLNTENSKPNRFVDVKAVFLFFCNECFIKILIVKSILK